MSNLCKLNGYPNIGVDVLMNNNHLCCFATENKIETILTTTLESGTHTGISDNDMYTGIGIASSVILMFIFALVIDRCIHKFLNCNYYVFTAIAAFVMPYGLLIPYFEYVITNENLRLGVIIIVGVWSGIVLIGTIIICYLKRQGLCRRICECFNMIGNDDRIITHAISYESDYSTNIQGHNNIGETIIDFDPNNIPSSPD